MLTLALVTLAAVVAGCAAGTERFTMGQAGFWAGLWHGIIVVIAFIISLFSDSVRIYEVNNTGALYDLGFVLGVLISLGGSGRARCKTKQRKRSRKEQEWEEIGGKIEEKVRRGIKCWIDEEDAEEKQWEEIGAKVEEKIKRELRKWTDD